MVKRNLYIYIYIIYIYIYGIRNFFAYPKWDITKKSIIYIYILIYYEEALK